MGVLDLNPGKKLTDGHAERAEKFRETGNQIYAPTPATPAEYRAVPIYPADAPVIPEPEPAESLISDENPAPESENN
jgi:hypothetical protein